MLVRNLDFLSIPKEFSKVEVDIYDGKSIALVYIGGKGYSLVLKQNDVIDSIFLLKTDILPNNINEHQDKQDFINVIKMLLDKIYSVADIKEYEKQHNEKQKTEREDRKRTFNQMLNKSKSVVADELLFTATNDFFKNMEI